MDSSSTVEFIATNSLKFDPQNPRFYRLNDRDSVDQVIDEMLDYENVQDLMLSIGQKGYFAGEPLLVLNDGGEKIVIEGNRRLAAVKLLNKEITPPPRKQNSVNIIIDEAEEVPPTELPCLVYPEKKDILRYLGYRHITGIKNWDSLSKALYLSELKDGFYSGESENNQLRSLAKDIGSRPDYVKKLLIALKLYKTAEDARFFNLHMEADDVEFSYITTAIGYENIKKWLEIYEAESLDLPDLREDHLKNLFAWMFSKDQQGNTILGETRNLGKMASIVANNDAVEVLVDTLDIDEAYLYSDGPLEALNKAFVEIIKQANSVWNLLNKVSMDDTHLDNAETLFSTSKRIRNMIRNELDEQ